MMKKLIFVLLIVLAYCDTCGQNCPSDKCPTCWCGNQKSVQNITELCKQYNWNVPCCQCIMSRLSGGNSNFMDYDTNLYQWSVGLWQLGPNYKTYCSGVSENPPCSVQNNMKCAWQLYNDNWRGRWNGWANASKACGCYTPSLQDEGQLEIQVQ